MFDGEHRSRCPCRLRRPRGPSQAQQLAHRQRDAGRGRLGDGPAQLDPAGGARHPYTSLQSVLELDGAQQVHGAIQKEAEEDHQRGNLFTPPHRHVLSFSCCWGFFFFPSLQTDSHPGLSQHLCLWYRRQCKCPTVEKQSRSIGVHLYSRRHQSHTLIQFALHCFNSSDWWKISEGHR